MKGDAAHYGRGFGEMRVLQVVAVAIVTPFVAGISRVRRVGNQLMKDGQVFRFGGANMYWLGLDENVPPGTTAFPTAFRQMDAMDTAVVMGTTVVRCHTCGISTGNPLSFEPNLDKFVSSNLNARDEAVALASARDIHLVVPLTDNWHYYHGGKHDFTDWLGVPESEFFTNETVIAAFERYIEALLTRKSSVSGLTLAEDPTILAFETGNEIQPDASNGNWTCRIAKFIKSLAPDVLVLDGTNGLAAGGLECAEVDLVSQHFYPSGNTVLALLDAAKAKSFDKVYFVGEFGWDNGDLEGFLDSLGQDQSVAGWAYWSLFPHLDTYGFEQHGDHYTLHYPGDNPDFAARVALLRAHSFNLTHPNSPTPPTPPPSNPPANLTLANGAITWRGTAGAGNYSIQGATDAKGPFKDICTMCANDNALPYPLQAPLPPFLRVVPFSADGKSQGPPSNPISTAF